MKMIKFLGVVLALLLIVGFNTNASAGAYGTESITVSNTVIGFTDATINPGTGNKPFKAVFTIETAQIRFTVDGTTPTTTVGFLGNINDVVTINGQHDIQAFKAIRTGSTDAVIQPIYFDDK